MSQIVGWKPGIGMGDEGVSRQNAFGTFLAPFGYPIRTHEFRWAPIGIDFSDGYRQDGSGPR